MLLSFLVVKVHTDAMLQLSIGNYRFSASCVAFVEIIQATFLKIFQY